MNVYYVQTINYCITCSTTTKECCVCSTNSYLNNEETSTLCSTTSEGCEKCSFINYFNVLSVQLIIISIKPIIYVIMFKFYS